MGREVRGGFDQQTRDRVVDFGGFDRRQTEADLGDGGDEGFEEVPEGGAILAVSPDVNSRQHNLRMMPGEGGRLGHQLGNGARPVRPARDRGRAEGAVLVAAILDLEPAADVRGGMAAARGPPAAPATQPPPTPTPARP